jgi:hypothetical protein
MSYDPQFGPAAQTPQQRAYVLQQLQAVFPQLRKQVTPAVQQLYARYIAGELSWQAVRQLRDTVVR